MKRFMLTSTIINVFAVRAFMSDSLETVTIVGDNGPVRINKSEFDEKKHKLHKANKTHDENGIARNSVNADEPKPGAGNGKNSGGDVPKSDALTVEQLAENARINAMKFGVMADDNKFFVVDANDENKRVENVDGIDNKNGYKKSADAWKAVFAVQGMANKGTAA